MPAHTPKTTPARTHLTPERVRKAACPDGKKQHFIRDDAPRSLALRITSGGAKAFVYEFRVNGRNGRVTIGGADAWAVADARAEARRLQVLVDSGIDPRDEKAERERQAARQRLERERQAITLGDLWPEYLKANEGRWSESHRKDHYKAMQRPGERRKRSSKLTVAGPLYGLSGVRLVDFSADRLRRWLEKESAHRPATTARAFRLLRAFIHWTAETPEYSGLVDPVVLSARKVRRAVPSPKAKKDSLQREMLADWFKCVGRSGNPVVSAYLEALLLTGARREEMAGLRWRDVDFQWRSLTIRDKVEGERVIPLTPFLAYRLNALPRRNEWVFSSTTSEQGRIMDVYRAHNRILQEAGLPHVSIHGLRRSFGSLSEWVGCPVGIVAQIQGHKPSAIAEKHYRERPLDLLRVWHTQIEGWILEEAGVEQPERGEKVALVHDAPSTA